MTEQDIRNKFHSFAYKDLPVGHRERPTCLHMEFNEQGRPIAAEIRGIQGNLWSWPDGFRAERFLKEKNESDFHHLNLRRGTN